MTLLDLASLLPPEQQDAFYRKACAGRAGLLDAVLELEAASGDYAPALDTARLNSLAPQLFDRSAEQPDPLLGQEVGGYRILERIGEGGMGCVYKAQHIGYQGMVALKVLLHVHGTAAQERLQREAKLLARCSHPSIVGILYSGLLPNGDPYFTMQLVEGDPITDYCRRKGLDLQSRLRLFNSVCEGVQAAHFAAVIHRDLKPNNTLVDRNGHVRLLDFGTSEEFNEEYFKIRTYISPMYAAPEIMEATSVLVDVYSLGVLLSELVLGRAPCDTRGESEKTLFLRLTKEGLPPLRFWKRQVLMSAPWLQQLSRLRWQELEAICAKAAAPDPSGRYASVDDLRRDTERFLTRRPVHALPDRWHYRGRCFVSRHELGLAVAAMVLVLLVSMAVDGVWTLHQQRTAARQQRDAAVREDQGHQAFDALLQALFIDGDAIPATTPASAILARGMRFATTLNSRPADQAQIYETLGESYQGLSDYTMASTAYQDSMAAIRRMGQAGRSRMAELYAQVASMGAEVEDTRSALSWAEKAVALDAALPADSTQRLEAEAELAQVDRLRGDLNTADSLLVDVIHKETGHPAMLHDLSQAENELSLVAEDMGELPRFYRLQQESMAIDRVTEGPEHPDIGEHLLSLADVDGQIFSFARSESDARQALRILSAHLPPDHPDIASARVILAVALAEQGKTAEAIPLFEDMLRTPINPHNNISNHALAAWGLGMAREKSGQLAQARSADAEALALYRRMYPGGNSAWVSPLSGMSAIDRRLGHPARAVEEAHEALAQCVQQPLATPLCVHARLDLGEALAADHRYAEAREQLTQVVALDTPSRSSHLGLAPIADKARRDLASVSMRQKADGPRQ